MASTFFTSVLAVGATGTAVTLLQSQLLQLYSAKKPKDPFHMYIAPSELATATFGPYTRVAVLTFQKENQSLFASAPTGNVDRETAAVLSTCLSQAGIDLASPPRFFIVGDVRYTDGSTSQELSVSVYDKDLRDEKLLFTVAPVQERFFSGSCIRKQLIRNDAGRQPTLSTRVVLNKRVIYETSVDEALYEAPALSSIRIQLQQRPPSASSSDSFTSLINALDKTLPPVESKEQSYFSAAAPDAQLRERISRIREDSKSKDLSYLVRLKSTSTFSKAALTNVVLAHRLTATAQAEAKISLPPELFYALLATDTYRNITAQSSENLGQADLDLNTPMTPLMYRLALLDETVVKSALEKAVMRNLAPPSVISGEFSRALADLRRKARDWIIRQPTVEDQVWTMIQEFLDSGKQKAVKDVLNGENIEGDIFDFLERLVGAFSKKTTTSGAQAASGLSRPPDLRAAAARLRASSTVADLQKLAEADNSTLSHLIVNNTTDGNVSHDDAAVKEVASQLAGELAKEFPTRTFRAKMRRHVSRAKELDKPQAAIKKAASFGSLALSVDANAIVQFLDAHDDFDLRHSKINVFHAKTKLDEQTKLGVAKVQRVFKLAPTFEKTRALMDEGVHSAAQIVSMGRPRFLATFGNTADFTATSAAVTYDSAVDVHLATSLLAGNLQGAASALLPAGISLPLPPAKVEALIKNFPNMASLFQSGDICACSECMTVYSPSAYLVDVLEFFKNRHVLESADGPDAGRTARDKLFARRSDLADLDLSCDNTNVTLPYIDLVCELLEDFVAPDGLSPGSFSGTVAKGKITAPLLELLRDGLKLPFTESAIVSDVYNGGYRTVRDRTYVVSLGPAGGKVKVLRQTYGNSDSLSASPAYVNRVAYNRLATSTYLPTLPFDLTLAECGAYLRQLGTPRIELMEALAPDAAFLNAVESIGISATEASLIINADVAGQEKYWNTGDPANTVGKLKNVLALITAARIEYTELQSLIDATSWLNPPRVPPPNRGVDRVGALFIKHKDSSCNLKEKDIEGLDKASLDRMHRFLRFLKALARVEGRPEGWTVALLDRFITASKLGAGVLNGDCLAAMRAASRLASDMSKVVFTTTVADIVDIFAGLSVVPTSSRQLVDDTVTYNSVFLNPTAIGLIDTDFEVRNIALNDSPTPPATIPKLFAKAEYVARCLSISPEDARTLAGLISPTNPDPILTLDNLSAVFAVVSICRRCEISIDDYATLVSLSKVDPLAGLGNLSLFSATIRKMQGLELSATDTLYLTLPPTTSPLSLELPVDTATQILVSIQKKFNDVQTANRSPFDENLNAAENQNTAVALLSQIRGVTQPDLNRFQQMLAGHLSASDGATLIADKLHGLISAGAENLIVRAQAALAASPARNDLMKELARVVCSSLTEDFASGQRQSALLEALEYFELTAEMVAVFLENVPSLRPLLDKALATGTVSKDNFPQQYRAIYLLHRLAFFTTRVELPEPDVAWLLSKGEGLGWADLRTLPVEIGDPKLSWQDWLYLLDFVEAVKQSEYPTLKNAENAAVPISLRGLLESSVAAGADLPTVAKYASKLIVGSESVVSKLVNHFGFTLGHFKRVATLRQLETATQLVRRSGLPVEVAISLAKATTPTREDITVARDALQSRYPVSSDWLTVLKNINDPLRIRKRDGLIDYILARNKESLTSAKEISEILLIDVEMGSETVTSRIIQAHQSVQQFAQRLLMGLEPTPIVPDDPFWTHWTEMSQYRLWEANKKVFLYPEMWIEPELRDNKSELYSELETALKKEPMTATNVERVVAGYLDGVEHIADLEVMSTFYDAPLSTSHVFARTRGGNPREYYHRTLIFEADWSPWAKLAGVEISGNHLISFKRNSRLTVAWPIFTLEQDPVQQNTPPPIPDPNNLANEAPQSRRQRMKIQLSISTKDPDTGRWSTTLTSQEGVIFPGPGESYADAEDFPEFLEQSTGLQYVDLEGNLGQCILVCQFVGGVETKLQATVNRIFGVFQLAGCKGYPEPFKAGLEGELRRSNRLQFLTYPHFRNTAFTEQRFIKDRSLANSSPSDLAIRTIMGGSNFTEIMGKEFGRFRVTYPTQITLFDRLFFGMQLYSLGRTQTPGVRESFAAVYRALILPMGTFLPYFVTDSSTRGYCITPGYESSEKGDTNFRTASETLDFLNRSVKLVLKYIDVYQNEMGGNIKILRSRVNEDTEYNNLKAEFLKVYFNAEDPKDMHFRNAKGNIVNFYHPLVCFLKSKLYNGGIPTLLARKTQLAVNDFSFTKAYDPREFVRSPYPQERLEFALADPYSDYNWELFFHLPFQIAARFSANQQFELARNWYHYIFNPQGSDTDDPALPPEKAAAPQKKYWVTNPFFRMQVDDYAGQLIDSLLSEVSRHPNGFSLADSLKTQIQLWRANPFSPHVVARTRPVAYQMCVVLKYIQNLIDWGDQLFTQLTRETITQASTLYMVAEKLLGPKPRVIPPAVPVPVKTYNELSQQVDLLGNAMLTLENLVPDLGLLPHHGDELPSSPPLSMLYFGIPPNTKMLELWDLVADRLLKIRHSQDINGNFVSLSLTSPPIDPGALVRALASGVSLQDVVNGLNAPISHYRFAYVLERARGFTQMVISLGSQLLTLLQRRDEEGLARLKAGSELTVMTAVKEAKILAVAENVASFEALKKSREVSAARKEFYGGLLKAGLNQAEKDSIEAKRDTGLLDIVTGIGHLNAAQLHLIPSFSVGIAGFGGSPNVSMSVGGSNAASAVSSFLASVGAGKSLLETSSQLYATSATYIRRSEDWKFQSLIAEKEMAHIDKQMEASKVAGQMLTAELKAHNTSIVEATSAETYLRSKYTNKELFDWAVGRTTSTYFGAYQLAFRMAKRAERCLQFELGDFSGMGAAAVKNGYWDTLHSGLLAGEELLLDLGRLEAAHLERHERELEISKPVSLAKLDPIALLSLRTKGECTFTLPEYIFDLDHPGHYFRRFKTLAVSIPCVVGPFTSVSATLRQLSSRYRASTARSSAYAENPLGSDDRFVYNLTAPSVVTVVSTGANDTGVLDMRAEDPRYLPFEHAGVLGTYSLELPPVSQFDYSSIADVVLHVSYTARDGGSTFRDKAAPAPIGGTSIIPLRTAFPAQWNALLAGRAAEPVLVTQARLPHWATAQRRIVLPQVTTWCALPVDGVEDLEGLEMGIANTNVAFSKDTAGFWRGSLAAGKVKYEEKVKLEWKNVADAKRVGELSCVLDFNVKEPAAQPP